MKASWLLFSSYCICIHGLVPHTFRQSRNLCSSLGGRLILTGILLPFQMQKEESKDKRRRRRSDE